MHHLECNNFPTTFYENMFPREKTWTLLPCQLTYFTAQIIKLCNVKLNFSNLTLMIYVLEIDKLSGEIKEIV